MRAARVARIDERPRVDRPEYRFGPKGKIIPFPKLVKLAPGVYHLDERGEVKSFTPKRRGVRTDAKGRNFFTELAPELGRLQARYAERLASGAPSWEESAPPHQIIFARVQDGVWAIVRRGGKGK